MMTDDLPPFPAPPSRVPRFEHPPTVARGHRYWLEVWLRTDPTSPTAATAITLASLYAAALEAMAPGPIAGDGDEG
jgi:hypothetical protein